MAVLLSRAEIEATFIQVALSMGYSSLREKQKEVITNPLLPFFYQAVLYYEDHTIRA